MRCYTGFDVELYQHFDKAFDAYYLMIAYVATLRNWTDPTAITIGRWLFYFRLIGVALFADREPCERPIQAAPRSGSGCVCNTVCVRTRGCDATALLSAVALIAACGGNSNGDDASTATAEMVASTATASDTTDSPSSDFEVLDPADLASVGPDDLDPVSIRQDPLDDAPDDIGAITDRSARLVERFGAEGAFDALVYALARGYSGDAVAAAIDREDLQADGTIPGVMPMLDSSDLLVAPSRAAGFAGQQRGREGSPVAIEELRRAAQALRAAAEQKMEAWDAPEVATAEGVAVLNMVQALAHAGLSGDQIINAIVLGYGGMERRIAQVGMGPATMCRMVVIGGRAEPIANGSGCERYAEVDRRLRGIYADHGAEYPPCDATSIDGFYDACAGSEPSSPTSTSTAPTSTVVVELPTSWEGTLALDPVAGELVDSFVAIDRAADGSFSLNAFVEFTRESLDCSWTDLQTAEGTGELAADGNNIHFEGTFTSDIESSGGNCASGSESVKTTYDVAIDDRTLSGSIFAYTDFELAP